jgi:hypothetical protein
MDRKKQKLFESLINRMSHCQGGRIFSFLPKTFAFEKRSSASLWARVRELIQGASYRIC